jgi:hypothetical protein
MLLTINKTQGSSATRCNSLSNTLESHSISLELAIKQGDEWSECSLAQTLSQVFKGTRGKPPRSATFYLKRAARKLAVRAFYEGVGRVDARHRTRDPRV